MFVVKTSELYITRWDFNLHVSVQNSELYTTRWDWPHKGTSSKNNQINWNRKRKRKRRKWKGKKKKQNKNKMMMVKRNEEEGEDARRTHLIPFCTLTPDRPPLAAFTGNNKLGG